MMTVIKKAKECVMEEFVQNKNLPSTSIMSVETRRVILSLSLSQFVKGDQEEIIAKREVTQIIEWDEEDDDDAKSHLSSLSPSQVISSSTSHSIKPHHHHFSSLLPSLFPHYSHFSNSLLTSSVLIKVERKMERIALKETSHVAITGQFMPHHGIIIKVGEG